jgi:hypothetical protein
MVWLIGLPLLLPLLVAEAQGQKVAGLVAAAALRIGISDSDLRDLQATIEAGLLLQSIANCHWKRPVCLTPLF